MKQKEKGGLQAGPSIHAEPHLTYGRGRGLPTTAVWGWCEGVWKRRPDQKGRFRPSWRRTRPLPPSLRCSAAWERLRELEESVRAARSGGVPPPASGWSHSASPKHLKLQHQDQLQLLHLNQSVFLFYWFIDNRGYFSARRYWFWTSLLWRVATSRAEQGANKGNRLCSNALEPLIVQNTLL